MKKILKTLVAASLAILASLVVRKYHPRIVMVTGSVGKTSTKDAMAMALSETTLVRASEKSYNSEFGVPFTIFGVKNPWSNPLAWLAVYKEALALLLFPNHYPKLLVLEVGADRPGDLMKILHIALPDAVVVTRLPEVPVHVEAYPTPEAVREEEFVPAYGLANGAPLIISADDAYAKEFAERLQVSVSTFGFAEGATVQITNMDAYREKDRVAGMQATLLIGGKDYPLVMKGVYGRPQLLAPAAAIALAMTQGVSVEDALLGLKSYTPPPGRMRLLAGKCGTLLIDDSYNSSPIAVEEALRALHGFPDAVRRIAVLGDMLELGRYSVEEHARIGTLAAANVDVLITVGVRARAIADAARTAGMPAESVMAFGSATEASAALLPLIEAGDVILMKGSQNNIRLERVTESLLADPADSSKLVRQEREWKRR
jgi:UDP-N-acetylmuramoyl-tripeptide--D-alanyl-D-alanine ligase